LPLAPAPDIVPQGSYSNVNYFENSPLQPKQGNNEFNDNVSNNARGNGKKGKKALAVDYSGGNGNDIYDECLGRNVAFKNLNNQGRRKSKNKLVPDFATNNGVHMGNVSDFNGQMRHDWYGNIGQGSIMTQPESYHGGG
jgi:hypothetical protein